MGRSHQRPQRLLSAFLHSRLAVRLSDVQDQAKVQMLLTGIFGMKKWQSQIATK